MKKRLFFILGSIVVIMLAWAGVFAWKNLRGIGPAVRAPARDIAEVIEKGSPSTPITNPPVGGVVTGQASLENNTGFPLQLPPGFSIRIFAKGLGKPRVIVKDPAGGLLVSIPSQGRVVSLPDDNNDGVADRVVTVVAKLNKPHGMVAHCDVECTLTIAESYRVARYRYDTTTRTATFETKLFDLPDGGGHFTRTLLATLGSNDEGLMVSVGSSCNACKEKDMRRAAVLTRNNEGPGMTIWASGLRNSVFMVMHPWTKKIWATEMGRDLLGDNLPPDEVNIVEPTKDYGWPYCYGKQVHDDNFDPKKTHTCDTTTPSTIDLPAHSAPLGLAFIPDTNGWPKEYWYDLLIAFHGSWNRSEPTGYKIVRYPLDEKGNREGEPVDFISGWLQKDGTALGRPVGLLIEDGGVLYISDDKAGVIYKVWKN